MLGSKAHRIIFLLLLTLLGGSMMTSVFMANLAWVLLGVNWLLEGRWREKWQMAKESRLLQAYLGLYLLLLAGMLWTENVAHGFSVLQVKLPLLVVPLVLLTTRPVMGRARQAVLGVYIGTVLVVSIIGTVRIFTIPNLPYRDAVPYISHIRFALNCCMVIFLVVSGEWTEGRKSRPIHYLFSVLLILWLLIFIVMLHSYTALAILLVVSLVLLLFRYRRWQWVLLWVAVVGSGVAVICNEVKSYYSLVPLAQEPLHPFTAGGRPYKHSGNGVIENGNYIGNYVCREELRHEWNRRSRLPFDSLGPDGYGVDAILIRYLNALGLTKDSVGVWSLSESQVHHIEQGVANPVYLSRNPIRKMVYVILFEYECYRHTEAVTGFTMLQRLELWEATLGVVRQHPWVGVGTGDVDDAVHAQLAAQQSPLTGTTMSPHNQYLSLLTALGAIGIAILIALFLRPLLGKNCCRLTTLMLAWLLLLLISMLTEDTLDTLAGQMLCTWFLAFRQSKTENVRIPHTA